MTAREYMAERLKKLRKRSGMTVKEVGLALDKSDKTISAWEVGRGQPDADMLVALCRLYNARISDFFIPEVSGDETLNENEAALVESYRNANKQGQDAIIAIANASMQSLEN